MNSYIGTYTGKHFYPLEPKAEDICIEDIAHSLSNLCRFNGHTKRFYSVAQHSLNVERFIKKLGWGKRLRLYGLMHDFAEAYIGDMTTPYKNTFGSIVKETEREIMTEISKQFGIEPHLKMATKSLIKEADEYVLSLEARKYMKNTQGWNLMPICTKYKLSPRLPRKIAEWLLIYRFNKLRRAYELYRE